MTFWRLSGLALALLGAGCGEGPRTAGMEALTTQIVTMPSGEKIRAEVMVNPVDLQRGMMFRDELPRGRGMLFIHPQAGAYPYYMYQVKIPLDIIFLDRGRRVVEIAADVPPCKTKASECPTYGGHVVSQYALELAGGEAQRLRLRVGDTLSF